VVNEIFQLPIIVNIFASTIRIATPLLLASMGELVTEHAGVWNMGLEGTVLTGAYVGFLVANKSGSLLLAVVAAIIAGGSMSLIMAFMASSLKLDQTVIGMTLNLLASGATIFWYKIAFQDPGEHAFPTISTFDIVRIPILADIPILGEILFSHKALTYIAFLMIPIIWFFLYRTRPGLQLRSIGENPQAVDMRGINVTRHQYFGVIFGGMMAGLAGSFLTLGASDRFIPEMSAGRGWLAIVIIIAGNWRPIRILFVTLAFAFIDAFQLQLQGIGVHIPYQFLLVLPYVFAIIAMMGSRARSTAPTWLGIPYSRE
jgi:ABC-type uncharacterized transport system permease subunit